jgi:di/tripeptidase
LFAVCTNNNPADRGPGTASKTPYDYFVELSAIPRCTFNEEAASNHIAAFARAHGLWAHQDKVFNVLVRKNGSRGRENEPPVILQAHIDMICRKDEDVDHDFERDPIIPVIQDDGWVTAQKRTTLGADNGSGVSMIMAILASRNISHPPIEALLTTQEEIGLVGADLFDVSLLNGRRLINLDWTTEGVFIVSSKWNEGPQVAIPMEPEALARIAAFPDWLYRDDSPLRDRMAAVFRNFYGREPIMAGINNRVAGVECIVFAGKVPDMDMVSIGPDILGIHTPDERMNLASYNRVYEYIVRVLEEL